MAEIKPFRGVLYNPKKVDIEKVVTPPYDVISQSAQTRFYRTDKHNAIRLILGKEEKKDTPNNNRYTRANIFLTSWLKEKILARDKKPAIYIYTQEYLYKGKRRKRFGFIALMKIEDPRESGVLPHEYTLQKPKEDRFNLISKTKANLSPIFSLFEDKKNSMNILLKSFTKNKEPLFITEQEGVVHRLWRADSEKIIKKITAEMNGKKIFIADGHHRYEVALIYRNKMRKSGAFTGSMNYVMMYFSNLSEGNNLTILSTHRVVRNIEGFDESAIIFKLKKYFDVKKTRRIEDLFERLEKPTREKHVFGMNAGKGKFYLLALKKNLSPEVLIESDKTPSLKRLDVTILHEVIINKILCIKNPESSIKYVRNELDASKLVESGFYKIAFFLRPTKVTQMKKIAEKGEMMPQKSTYFYPKLLTGLVINKF